MKIIISNNKLENSNLKNSNHKLRKQLPPRVGKHEFGTLSMVNPNWMKGQKHDMPFNSFYLLVLPEIFNGFATCIP
jgi:hypothetical protein